MIWLKIPILVAMKMPRDGRPTSLHLLSSTSSPPPPLLHLLSSPLLHLLSSTSSCEHVKPSSTPHGNSNNLAFSLTPPPPNLTFLEWSRPPPTHFFKPRWETVVHDHVKVLVLGSAQLPCPAGWRKGLCGFYLEVGDSDEWDNMRRGLG